VAGSNPTPGSEDKLGQGYRREPIPLQRIEKEGVCGSSSDLESGYLFLNSRFIKVFFQEVIRNGYGKDRGVSINNTKSSNTEELRCWNTGL
jgi:hypothetical protein